MDNNNYNKLLLVTLFQFWIDFNIILYLKNIKYLNIDFANKNLLRLTNQIIQKFPEISFKMPKIYLQIIKTMLYYVLI